MALAIVMSLAMLPVVIWAFLEARDQAQKERKKR